MRGDSVKEPTIVRDNDYTTRKFQQGIFLRGPTPADCSDTINSAQIATAVRLANQALLARGEPAQFDLHFVGPDPDAVTSVGGTACCAAHAVLLTHPHDAHGRRRARLAQLRSLAEAKAATAPVEDQPGLWIHSQDGGVDAICAFLQHLLQKFDPAGAVTFEWSNDCSKPRIDAYGGRAAIVTAEEIQTMSTSAWLRENAA